jgi:hypothetical protein
MANNRKIVGMNNRSTTKGRMMRKQVIMSEPTKIFVGTYTTPSGDTKNKYKHNPNAKPVKVIYHKM